MSVNEAIRRFGLKQFKGIGWNGRYSFRCKQTNRIYTISPIANVVSIVLGSLAGLVVPCIGYIFLVDTSFFKSAITGVIFLLLCIVPFFYVTLYVMCKQIKFVDTK